MLLLESLSRGLIEVADVEDAIGELGKRKAYVEGEAGVGNLGSCKTRSLCSERAEDEAANVGKVKTRQAAATRKDEAAAINIPRVTTVLVAKRG